MKIIKIYQFAFFISISILRFSCIGDNFIDDFVEPVIRITNAIDTLGINTSYQMEASVFDNVGMLISDPISWSSSNPDILSITSTGIAKGLQLGDVTITAMSIDATLASSINVTVGGATTEIATEKKRSGIIKTTSSYALEGNFELENIGGAVTLTIFEDYKATSALPGLYVYLSNNPNSISEAYEISAVKIFEGFHSYPISNSVGLNDFSHLIYFCKPFNVKVGEGVIGDPK